MKKQDVSYVCFIQVRTKLHVSRTKRTCFRAENDRLDMQTIWEFFEGMEENENANLNKRAN